MDFLGGYGVSSIGRVAVSKTVGWRFKSSTPCQSALAGEVAEWSIAAVLKTALGQPNGGSNPSLSANIGFIVNNWIHIAVWTVVIGAVFGYLWWQGQVQRLAVYVQETREELKKCTWPTQEELKGSTLLIMVMVGLLGAFVVIVDTVLFKLFF